MHPAAPMVIGIAICVIAAILIVTDVVGVGWGSAIGVIGLGVIGAGASGGARR